MEGGHRMDREESKIKEFLHSLWIEWNKEFCRDKAVSVSQWKRQKWQKEYKPCASLPEERQRKYEKAAKKLMERRKEWNL